VGTSITVDPFGNVYVAGYTNSFYNGSAIKYFSALLVKYDASGNLQFSRTWGVMNQPELAYGVATDSVGNVYLTGENFLVKFDMNGNLLWAKTTSFTGLSIAVDQNGDFYVVSSDLLLKFDSTGSLIFAETGDIVPYGDPAHPGGPHLAIDSEGNVYVGSNSPESCSFLKFDSSGKLLFAREWTGTGDCTSIAVDKFGNVWLGGSSIVKFDPSGNVLFAETLNDYNGYGFAVDSAGDAYLTGGTLSFGAYFEDIFVLKCDSLGNLQFAEIWSNPTVWHMQFGTAVAVDSVGNPFVTGLVNATGPWIAQNITTSVISYPSGSGISYSPNIVDDNSVTTTDVSGIVTSPVASQTFKGGSAVPTIEGHLETLSSLSVMPTLPMNGTVLDSSVTSLQVRVTSNGSPIGNANVKLYVDGSEICSGISISSGYFSCNHQLTAGGVHFWTASANRNGYDTAASPPSIFSTGSMSSIPLATGWNLISLPLVPANTMIAKVLAAQITTNDVSSVWSYQNGKWIFATLNAGKLSGSLTTIQDGLGYWIYMTKADTLYVTGTVIPPTATPPVYTLTVGWNLVGFKPQPSVQSEPVGQYLASITGSYDANNVWIYTIAGWVRADASYVLQPGQGMWILMTAPATLRP